MSTKAEIAVLIEQLEECRKFTFPDRAEVMKRVGVILEEYADRLDAVAVSDAMVECASDAYATLSLDGVDMTAMRHALESILPIVDEQMTTRYKWLRNRMTVTEVQELERRGDQSEEAYEAEIDRAIDNAVASAKGDAR